MSELAVSENGTPNRIRTYDPRLRRPMLYPAELWVHRNKAFEGIRTPDRLITNQVLYQLSYKGIKVLQAGLEPARPMVNKF